MQQKKGFTLIELLVVIAIIAILSTIGLVALSGQQAKARDTKRQSDLSSFRTSLATYLDTNQAGTYPSHSGTAVTEVTLNPDLSTSLQPPTQGSGEQLHYYYLSNAAAPADTHFILYTNLEKPATTTPASTHFYINDQGFTGQKDPAAGGTFACTATACN